MKRRIALVGNPNVGKSTIFNGLTGMRQHTGNWSGVTVNCTYGSFSVDGTEFSIVDLPGIYSFDTRSEEEAVTKAYVQTEAYDFLILVCDATCLERGLHLLSQAAGIVGEGRKETSAPRLILCVNLCDEAAKKGIVVDFPALEKELGIPVVPCCARDRGGLDRLKTVLSTFAGLSGPCYPLLRDVDLGNVDVPNCAGLDDFSPELLAAQTVCYTNINYRKREEQLDRIFTGPVTGTFFMLLLLTGVFWLTITGANYPSSLLWDLFFRFETVLVDAAAAAGMPQWFIGAAIYGVYRVVAWIISVMLPPMAIFFPLFTLLEDFGFLPRIAYNMDGAFHSCGACGKQCLTMAMGLGCNAAGVTGCRIIDSPRERLIAILTNSLVPCNGRFPLLITMISLCTLSAFVTQLDGVSGAGALPPVLTNLLSALALTAFILLGVTATLGASRFLSRTVLKGVPSSFTLELPPYRRPQIGKVIVRSMFDRTLFVLARAVAVAAPAGLLIWLMANLVVDGRTLLQLCSGALDPLGRLMGLDGVILMAFILGFPANEIVLPIILMAYLQSGYLLEMEDTSALLNLLTAHGWTMKTFVCMAIFSLFHWPCSTTCLTIKKETGSWRWTAIAFLLPTLLGFLLCVMVSSVFQYI